MTPRAISVAYLVECVVCTMSGVRVICRVGAY